MKNKVFSLLLALTLILPYFPILSFGDAAINPQIESKILQRYKFDDNITATTGGIDGIISAGAPEYKNGKFGKAIGLCQTNAITIGNSKMDFSTAKTVTFWFQNPDGTNGGDMTVMGTKDWDRGVNPGFMFGYNGHAMDFKYNMGDGANRIGSSGDGGSDPIFLQDGDGTEAWIQYAITIDVPNKTVKVYNNGVLMVNNTVDWLTAAAAEGAGPLSLGRDAVGNYGTPRSVFFDELIIYSGLTDAEVALAYEGNTVVPPAPVVDNTIHPDLVDKVASRYILDGNLDDTKGATIMSGKKMSGTNEIEGTPTYIDNIMDPKYGKAVLLNKDSYIVLGDKPMDFTGGKTISFWLNNPNTSGLQAETIFANRDWDTNTSKGMGFFFNWNANDLYFSIGDGVNQVHTAAAGFTIGGAPDTWQHYAFTFDPVAKKMISYRNGTKMGEWTNDIFTLENMKGTAPMKFGADGVGKNIAPLGIYLDEITVFNGVLTDAEAEKAYSGAPVVVPPPEIEGVANIASTMVAGTELANKTVEALGILGSGNLTEITLTGEIDKTKLADCGGMVAYGINAASPAKKVKIDNSDFKLLSKLNESEFFANAVLSTAKFYDDTAKKFLRTSVSVDVYDGSDGKIGETHTINIDATAVTIKSDIVVPSVAVNPNLESKIAERFTFDDKLTNEKGPIALEQWGTLSYVAGKYGKAVSVNNTRNFAIGSKLSGKSMSMWINTRDEVSTGDESIIFSNSNWDSGGNKGMFFGYNYNNADLNLTISDGNGHRMNSSAPGYSIGNSFQQWRNMVFVFDDAGKEAVVYSNGDLTGTFNLADHTGDFFNGLGNLTFGADCNNKYKTSSELWLDEVIIYDQVLTSEDAKMAYDPAYTPQIIPKDPHIFTLIHGSTVADDGLCSLPIHAQAGSNAVYEKIEMDMVFDKDVMEVIDIQNSTNLTFEKLADGKTRLIYSPNKILPKGEIKEYAKTRIGILGVKINKINADKTFKIGMENIKFYAGGKEVPNVLYTSTNDDITILTNDKLDYNGDGVVGAGDVALAPTEQKINVAKASGIFPYKRALAITLDGGGAAFDPNNAVYVGSQGSVDSVRNNPYLMDLFSNKMATSFNCQSVSPTISAPNYNSILHGVFPADLQGEYNVTNESSDVLYQPDFGKADAKYPSIYKALMEQNPRRKYAGFAQWQNITNAIIEADLNVLKISCGGNVGANTPTYVGGPPASVGTSSDIAERLVTYIKNGYMYDTALTYLVFDDMDQIGHGHLDGYPGGGWFTDAYYNALSAFDGYYKKIIDAVKDQGLYDDTLLIFNADHGGRGTVHGMETPDNKTVFMGIGGQTVNDGAALEGGGNEDVPALLCQGLRQNKPQTMPKSDYFDSNIFLAQDKLSRKARDVEKLEFVGSGNGLKVVATNVKNNISVMDMTIDAQDCSVTEVTNATILSNVKTGKVVKLTVALNSNLTANSDIQIIFNSNISPKIKVNEIMLGTKEGKEIYCDLKNTSSTNPPDVGGEGYINGSGNITLSGSSTSETAIYKLLNTTTGQEMSNVLWSISGNSVGIASGIVVVTNNSTSGNYVISASCNGKTYTKTITVNNNYSPNNDGGGSSGGGGSSSGGGGGSRPGGGAGVVSPKWSALLAEGELKPVKVGEKDENKEENVGNFTDVPKSHWAANEIIKLSQRGIIKGDANTNTLRPEDNMTKEESIVMLLNVLGVTPKDGSLAENDNSSPWAKGYIVAAKNQGIITGDESGAINGANGVTRAEAMAIIGRAMGLEDADVTNLSSFADCDSIPDYAKPYVSKLLKEGLVLGYDDNTLKLNHELKRCEMFALVSRILEYKEK